MQISQFPNLKPIEPADREFISGILRAYDPQTSELTFTNLFIWRQHYGFQWGMFENCLVITCTKDSPQCYALPPVGPCGNRSEIVKKLLNAMKEKGIEDPKIERADDKLVGELDHDEFLIEETREHFDYVYKTEELISLEGGKFKDKRNHLNKLKSLHKFSYDRMDHGHIEQCIELSNQWCKLQEGKNIDISGEWEAVNEALTNFEALELKGAVIEIDGIVQAFSTGELLNNDTAVIHVEKAAPGIQGLYQAINQQFAEHQWKNIEFINREQDLGLAGLQKAKLSYNPVRLVKKYRIRLK